MRTGWTQEWRPYAAALGAWVAVTAAMVALRPSLRLATPALVYLLTVFLVAVRWGRGPSLAAGVLAFLALNYFFTIPFGTFRVAAPQDVVSLLAFLVVAEMTARLVTRLRNREVEAQQRAWEATTLYALTREITATAGPDEILDRVASRIPTLIGVAACSIYLPDDAGRLRLRTSDPRSPQGTSDAAPHRAQEAFATGRPVDDGTTLYLPLTAGGRVVGVLYLGSHPLLGQLPEASRRLVGTFADQVAAVIERLQLQRRAADAETLRRTDELKSALLSAVSHDLRTPLASIRIAATGLLQDDLHAQEEARRELLDVIDTEAARLSRLVNNLLDLSRIEAGALRPEKQLCNVEEAIARAVDGLRTRLRDHRVVVNVAAELPLVPMDLTEIEDVLVNLIDNSVRHSPPGATIRIAAEARDGAAVVLVENEGPPVPIDLADKVFDRFYRAGRDGRGVGLGLAICKGLVEAHGGRIWVERPGEPGARFAFSLPLGTAPSPAATPD